jgi:hypothetical protein
MSTMGEVKSQLMKIPIGRPFASGMFRRYGNRAAVDQSLCRLARDGEILRVSQGIYIKPKRSAVVGIIMPSELDVARAVVEGEEASLGLPGAVWALKFGLTTQVMLQTTFLSDGPTRHVRMGKAVLTILHAPPRVMRLAGTPAGRAILALEWLDEPADPTAAIAKVWNQLSESERLEFMCEAEARGGWVAKVARQFVARGGL